MTYGLGRPHRADPYEMSPEERLFDEEEQRRLDALLDEDDTNEREN